MIMHLWFKMKDGQEINISDFDWLKVITAELLSFLSYKLH